MTVKSIPGDLRSLTSLRFFAAIWVVMYHFRDQLAFRTPMYFALNHGTRAVDFFFILSGFILAHVYGPQLRDGSFRFGSFMIKRLARLYPVHLFTLCSSLGIFMLATSVGLKMNNPGKYDMIQFVPNLIMIQAWFPFTREAFNKPAWSISAEFFAYLLFPLLAGLVLRSKRGPWFWLAVAVAVMSVMLAVSWYVFGRPLLIRVHLGIFRIFPLFLLGIVLWRGWAARVFVVPRWLLFAGAAGVFFTAWNPVLAVPFFALIILAGAESDTRGVQGWLTAPWLVFLGEASYSLYMVHDLVQTVFFAALRIVHVPLHNVPLSIALYAFGIALSLAVAILCYKLIEVPGRRWITARFDRRDPPVGHNVAI